MKECDVLGNVEFGGMFSAQANNATLSTCCDFCSVYNLCKMYTYYPANRTCLLFENYELNMRQCSTQNSCQSGQISLSTLIFTKNLSFIFQNFYK